MQILTETAKTSTWQPNMKLRMGRSCHGKKYLEVLVDDGLNILSNCTYFRVGDSNNHIHKFLEKHGFARPVFW